MPQLSLYMDEDSMQNLRDAAALNDTTLSKYVADALRRQREVSCLWPRGYFDLYGSCSEKDLAEPTDTPFDLEPIPTLDEE